MSSQNYFPAMRRESLRAFFDASPTAKLIRTDYAPLIIDFLHRTFKSGQSISLGQADLRSQLASYQEEIHESDPSLLPLPPERYLSNWTNSGWLQRFLEASASEPQYQLTRFAEQAIEFVVTAISKDNSLVGTESRLRLVIETLEDIVRGASADPSRRLEYLKKQRALIDAEIEAVESGKSVQVYKPSQIRERFQTAVDMLRALQSDFRSVEERFQSITRDVQQQQASGDKTRGGILGGALDAEDVLKQKDDGISFFAFVAFLFSPSQQSELRKTIEEIRQLDALSDDHDSLARVRRMVPSLLAEADKVMKTTARLSSTLRRLLDAEATEHRLRLASVLRDIKQAALAQRRAPPKHCLLSVNSHLEIASPLVRNFWTPSIEFSDSAPQEHVIDLSRAQQMAEAFARMQRLDLRKLRSKIREATHEGAPVSLADLFTDSPIAGGVVELLGYLQIAHDDGHEIDRDDSQVLKVARREPSHGAIQVRVPKIVFHPKATNAQSGRRPR